VYVPNGPFEDTPPIAILGISRELKAVMYQGTPQDLTINGLTPGRRILPLHLKVMDQRLVVAKEYYYSDVPLTGRIIDVREDGEDISALSLPAMGPVARSFLLSVVWEQSHIPTNLSSGDYSFGATLRSDCAVLSIPRVLNTTVPSPYMGSSFQMNCFVLAYSIA